MQVGTAALLLRERRSRPRLLDIFQHCCFAFFFNQEIVSIVVLHDTNTKDSSNRELRMNELHFEQRRW